MLHPTSEQLLDPACQSLALVGIGVSLLVLQRYRRGAVVILLGAVWLALCATPAFANWLQRGLDCKYPVLASSRYPVSDAIVVLGGGEIPRFGVDFDNDTPAEQGTRTGLGLALYRAGRAPLILLTGGEEEAAQMNAKLLEEGVPSSALLTENVSMTTHENAQFSTLILRQHKLQRILLVTSAMHMPRAVATFRQQGLTVVPAPVAPFAARIQSRIRWLPQRYVLNQSIRCLREYFGLWAYRLRGWAD